MWEWMDVRVMELGWEGVVNVGVGLCEVLLSSKVSFAGELPGKAIIRTLPVLPMLKSVSGFRDGLAFPGLRGTDLFLTRFHG